ncbi:LacI family DNA-binding transcriptional regulator [Glaciihabitans arcticus]|uniref:LacI family DNA-binding transcriptional regulator n=1 Tax=Glaciihabitans arcticus TaxID=2668039 RepID=A0A4Q9GPG1_9MICO|nr:LacI family DNA-binding transcriptional regulator [Glaciihabitans arcticus]TBN55461.1 LacI family DNA-binding transcriptional regulator [Glaciihabitans arcticus]
MSTEDRARVANIFDVARLAGVSHQTVSRVVNNLPNVRPATRQRVEDAIKQLRYRPSTAARSLVTRRSRTIGLITTGSPDYGPSSTLIGFNEAARKARYLVSITSMLEADSASMRQSVDLLLSQNVEGLVLIAAHRGALEAIQGIDLGVPLVAVESSGRLGFHSVSIDQYQGAYDATMHLIELGHREIVHLAGPDHSMDATERVRGWRAALSEHGLVAREPLVGDWSPASGYRVGQQLARAGGFTGIFAGNDQMALGAMHALGQAGVSIPGDVSVIGFDDIPEAEHFSPPLTTIRQDFSELGRTVMSTLLELILDGTLEEAPHPAPQLVARESTGPLSLRS